MTARLFNVFPLLAGNAGLPNKANLQICADVFPVRIGYNQADSAFEHKLVVATGIGAVKPQCS